MTNAETLQYPTFQYLATRLADFKDDNCAAAVELVLKVVARANKFEASAYAEHALFEAVWGHVTRALDVGTFAPAEAVVLGALEAELAGRVLTARLALGWLAKTAQAPNAFPSVETFFKS